MKSSTFSTDLLAHYDQHRRSLPWRGATDPYRAWVSEVMLQQTRVDTVVPYYERWLQRFPTVSALATAELDEVLKAWEGLGYYTRARNLHAAARLIRERHNGALPESYAALRALPGIGEYSAGAIASIAYQQREPAVDGNVSRVLHRLLDRPRLAMRELREVAKSLVPAGRPGEFNQALMELGSTLCTPRQPSCDACPVARHCLARSRGTQLERPALKPRRAVPLREFTTVVVRDRQERILLRQRPATGLLAGLWEFPEREHVRFIRGRDLRDAGTIEHVFSHFRARYRIFAGRVQGRRVSLPLEWVRPTRLSVYAMPAAQRRIARSVLEL